MEAHELPKKYVVDDPACRINELLTLEQIGNCLLYTSLYKNIIPMVHSINVRICAEGIEEREWLLKMKAMKAVSYTHLKINCICGAVAKVCKRLHRM